MRKLLLLFIFLGSVYAVSSCGKQYDCKCVYTQKDGYRGFNYRTISGMDKTTAAVACRDYSYEKGNTKMACDLKKGL